MKKSLLLTLLCAAVVSYGVFRYTSEKKQATEAKQAAAKHEAKWKSKAARAAGYAQWRAEMTKNVYTGEVDPADYYKAVAQANQQYVSTKSSNKANGPLGIQWESKGPDSQGGRTRAILFDKDNPNLIYTGGISGGLWKSEDAAANWERVESYNGNNASIMSLAQTINGTLFVGTGESLAGRDPDGTLFNAAITGDGIYKSNDAGATWTHITATDLSPNPTFNNEWASVNSMATHPSNTNLLMVGNKNGIRISTDAEAPQPTFANVSGGGSKVSEVQFTSDGNEAWAAANGKLYKSTDLAGNFMSWSSILVPGATAARRAQIAISTVDNAGDYIIYASFTSSAGCLVGIFKSEDKGTTWIQLAYSGGQDPFAQPTGNGNTGCQGWYDHCLAVNPVDKDKIYIGGITFYTWGAGSGGLKRADQIDSEGVGSLAPNYIHADKHFIALSPHDSTGNTMLITGDGGVNKCLNANDGFPDNMIYTENNKNYTTLQCYSVGSGKYGEVMAGAQDNGTQYVNYQGLSFKSGKEVSGGDGVGGAEISNLSPGILFSGIYYGNLKRSLNDGTSVTNFLDDNIDPGNCGHITCSPATSTSTCDSKEREGQNFIYPFYLMETYERITPKKDLFVFARNEVIDLPGGGQKIIKDTIPPGDVTNMVKSKKIPGLDLHGLGLSYTIPDTLFPGDTVFYDSPFDSKYFVPTKCGSRFFVCTNPLQEGTSPRFSSVTIPSQAGIERMDASNDGDMLVGVSGSRVIVMQGWDSYDPDMPNTVNYKIANLSSVGANQLSGVSVNKSNKDHVLVSEHGYGSNTKVFVSFDASSSNPTFTNITNNLPEMPVYSCLIDKANPDRYILGTELGIWASNDAGASWHEENDGMGGRFPIFSVRQKWMNNFDCDLISAGSFGAGMFTTTTLMDCANKDNLIYGKPDFTSIPKVNDNISSVAVYPNPVIDRANLKFHLNKSSDVSVKIIDITGKVVSEKEFKGLTSGDQILEYDMSDIASSTYFVVVSSDGERFNNRLFIKK